MIFYIKPGSQVEAGDDVGEYNFLVKTIVNSYFKLILALSHPQ